MTQKLVLVLFVSFVLFLALGGVVAVFLAYVENDRVQSWDQYLSEPIPIEVVNDLCARNLIPALLGDCQNKNLQIQLRSIPHIFRADVASDAKLDNVNRLFGNYLVNCKADMLQSNSTRCQYKMASYFVVINYSTDTKIVASMEFPEP